MIVAIDAGNSRIKWGVFDHAEWVVQGVLPTIDAAGISEAAQDWPADARLVGCCVAGQEVEQAIGKALQGNHPPVMWLRSSEEACGVRNAYEQPSALGADRWAALIGARKMTAATCLVVCAGTATTADTLGADGLFRGGVILPGFELMRTSLANNTVLLPLADGRYSKTPRNTVDAIVSGCLNAQIGAIEKLYGEIAGEGAECVITGGSAQLLAPYLNIPFRLADNLILEGLVQFGAGEE